MWSQFPPNLSYLQNNLSENNVEPVPAKFELPPKQFVGKLCGASSLEKFQNNPPENNVEPVPVKFELPPKQSVGK